MMGITLTFHLTGAEIELTSNIALFLNGPYDFDFDSHYEREQPSFGCPEHYDDKFMNGCRFIRKYFTELHKLVKGNSVRNILIDESFKGHHSSQLIFFDRNCFHALKSTSINHPVCRKRGCKSFYKHKIDSTFFTDTYLCFSSKEFDAFYFYDVIDVYSKIKAVFFEFSLGYTVNRKPGDMAVEETYIAYHNAIKISITPRQETDIKFVMMCMGEMCHLVTLACAKSMMFGDQLPESLGLVFETTYINITYDRRVDHCDHTVSFSRNEILSYIPLYLTVNVECNGDVCKRFNELMDLDLFSRGSGVVRLQMTDHYAYDCNFTEYRHNSSLCGEQIRSPIIHEHIAISIPDLLDSIKLSTLVTDFFDLLFEELESILRIIFKIFFEVVVDSLKLFFELILKFISEEILEVLLDVILISLILLSLNFPLIQVVSIMCFGMVVKWYMNGY